LEHEKVVFGPEKMVIVPPRHYVIIDNPVVKDEDGSGRSLVRMDQNGQAVLRHGDQEIRFEQEPFPLYAGEQLNGTIKKLQIVEDKTALHLRAKRDFIDRFYPDNGKFVYMERKAGDEWLYKGPGTYMPQIEVDVINTIRSVILNQNQALRLRARDKSYDYKGVQRNAGEEWNVKIQGAYLPDVKEEVVTVLEGIILTHVRAIHVKSLRTYYDDRSGEKIERKAGTQWLITRDDCEVYIPEVYEEIVDSNVKITILDSRQYCIIKDPVIDGKQLLGTRDVRKGPTTFFLKPGEQIQGTYPVQIVRSDEYIHLISNETFVDSNKVKRKPGDKWIVYGPGEFYTPYDVNIMYTKKAFLVIEPLNIYLFSPVLFVLSILALFFAYVYGGKLGF
jgi:major vault protein